MTASLDDIIEYVRELGPVHAIMNDSHLGDATDMEIIGAGGAYGY